MDFKKLIENTKCPEKKRKAAEGFAERQAEREKRFVVQSKALTPSAAWYNRSYDL